MMIMQQACYEKEIDVTENLANSFTMLDEVVLVHTEKLFYKSVISLMR